MNLMIVVLGILSGIGVLSNNIILPAFDSISSIFEISSVELSWILNSFFITFAIIQLLIGPLSDKYGRKYILVSGLFVFAIGSLLCSYSNSYEVLIVGRIIQAIGASVPFVLSKAIARDLYDGETLIKAFSGIMVITAAAPGFSPLLGAYIESISDWRGIFHTLTIIGTLLFLFILLRFKETRKITKKNSLRDFAHIYIDLIKNKYFLLPSLSLALLMSSLYSLFVSAPFILEKEFSLNHIEIGLFFAKTVLIVFISGLLSPKITHKIGMSKTIILGFVLTILGGITLILLYKFQLLSLNIYYLPISLYLFGFGLVNSVGTAKLLQKFKETSASASSLLGFFQMIFSSLCIFLTLIKIDYSLIIHLGMLFISINIMALLLFILELKKIKEKII
jgi:MFS transporter, DHA1 family, multidrug resistance protein